MEDRHVIDRHTELIRHDLGEGGFFALPVR